MKLIIVLTLAFISFSSWAQELKASGVAKVFEGKNGEKVEIVEVNNSKEVIVKFLGVGGTWEGKTFLWKFEDLGNKKNVFIEKKRGSKMEVYTKMTYRDGQWSIYPEGNVNGIPVKYSKVDTEKLKVEDLLGSYKK